MALIVALLPDGADRDALGTAASQHRLLWADDWRDLIATVKREPAVAAVADLHAQPTKDGALRVLRFSRKFPRTGLLVWGDLSGRDLFRLGKAGATDVLMASNVSNGALVRERVESVAVDRIARRIDSALASRVHGDGRTLVQEAAARIPDGVQVPVLAEANGFSISTLERRCQEWGLTTPGRILLWLRIIYGLNWLQEPGRSVESVAGQVGYSSGAAFRRAVNTTVAGDGFDMREPSGLDAALVGFVENCPGLAMAQGGP